MPKKKNGQATGISWKTVFGILGSIAVLVGSIVSGLDFINYLREGYQQFLWLGITILGVIWLIVLYLLFKQRNIYWMLYVMVTVLAGVIVWNGWQSYSQAREAKLVVLIAKFDGPEEVYGLRNEILEKMNAVFANDADVEIESINEVITPDSESGSSRARELGKNLEADVVIWGWYRSTEDPNITIHFENLSPTQIEVLQESGTYQPQAKLADLEAFEIQRQLGSETSTLVSFLIGLLRFKAGDYQLALGGFEQILHEEDISTYINPFDLYFYIGFLQSELGDHEQSIRNYDIAIELNPTSANAYNNRGSAYIDIGEPERAVDDLDKAIDLNPKYPIYYFNRGVAYYDLGMLERAVDDFLITIELDPNSSSAHFNLGIIYAEFAQFEESVQEYSKAIELSPMSPYAYINRAAIYQILGEYDSAIRDYSQVIRSDQNAHYAYKGRGIAYQKLGKIAEAVADFKKYEELTGQSP